MKSLASWLLKWMFPAFPIYQVESFLQSADLALSEIIKWLERKKLANQSFEGSMNVGVIIAQ